jgi:hypothetical protein
VDLKLCGAVVYLQQAGIFNSTYIDDGRPAMPHYGLWKNSIAIRSTSFQLSYSSYIMLFFVVAIAIYLLGHITKQHPANLFLVDNQMSEIDRKVLALT